jgi:branched-chain amino acid transport system ATP-binding protein
MSTSASADRLLVVDGLRAGYGSIDVLRGIDLHVADGEYVAVIGANGAGKTTFLRALTRLIAPRAGCAVFGGMDLSSIPVHRMASIGIAHVPEGRQLFPRMTVLENLLIAAQALPDRRDREGRCEEVVGMFPRLRERSRQMAGTLSGGEQQMLAVGRALMLKPRLLLLDEPSQGLAIRIVAEVYATLRRVSSEGTAILLVEQNIQVALREATRTYVFEHGLVAQSGASSDLAASDSIRRNYLGL